MEQKLEELQGMAQHNMPFVLLERNQMQDIHQIYDVRRNEGPLLMPLGHFLHTELMFHTNSSSQNVSTDLMFNFGISS